MNRPGTGKRQYLLFVIIHFRILLATAAIWRTMRGDTLLEANFKRDV